MSNQPAQINTHDTAGELPATYEAVKGWDGNSWEVKRNGKTVRRGFDSERQAQDWADSQTD